MRPSPFGSSGIMTRAEEKLDSRHPHSSNVVQLRDLSVNFSSSRELIPEEEETNPMSPEGVSIVQATWIPLGENSGDETSEVWTFSTRSSSKHTPGKCDGRTYAFIEGGYRPAPLTVISSVQSLFKIHNETVNVWTHVVGAGLFLHKLVQLLTRSGQFPDDMRLVDSVVFALYILAAINCMVLSSLFHLFSSASESTYQLWEVLDRFGILMLMLGSNVPMIFYGFYDRLEWQITYLTCSILGVATANLVLNLQRLKEFRSLKLVVFGSVALIGWCQLAHDIWERGGLQAAGSQAALEAWVQTFSWYVLGVAFYALQFPERLWPGRFDLVGASHQLWHVCVVLGAMQHLEGCLCYARLAGAFAPRV